MYRLLAVGLLFLVAGCPTPPNQECLDDALCTREWPGPGRRCLFNGRTGTSCAQPDSNCDSGYRWVDTAGPMSNQCVPTGLVPDGGTQDGHGG